MIITHLQPQAEKQIQLKVTYGNGCASSVGGPFCSVVLKKKNKEWVSISPGDSHVKRTGRLVEYFENDPKEVPRPHFLVVT